jgi:hypothetical protein
MIKRGAIFFVLGVAVLQGCGGEAAGPVENDPDTTQESVEGLPDPVPGEEAMDGGGENEGEIPPDITPEDDDGAEIDADESEDGGPDWPRPPGVGLMHTAQQLQFMADHAGLEPWHGAWQQLMYDAENALLEVPSPMENFDVPFYYANEEEHEAAKSSLSGDAYAAYALALGYQLAESDDRRIPYAEKAIELLDAWAFTNRQVSGPDGDLVMMYRGVMLLYAADLVWRFEGWTDEGRLGFLAWVRGVFLPSADVVKVKPNNPGDWGTLGAIAAAAILEDPAMVRAEIERIKGRIEDTIDAVGELPEENLRTNSGMWYTYFALTSMTAAAWIARNTTGEDLFEYTSPGGRSIRLALSRSFYYCLYPEAWPYELPDGLAGIIQQALYPCDDEVEIPTPQAWPGNLFEIMSSIYGEDAWESWIEPYRPIKGWHAWIYPTLMRSAD